MKLKDLKTRSFQKILDDNSLGLTKDLKNLSPKMFQIMNNINRFTKDSDSGKVPTGKILFYSDFRSDGGSEAFELTLKSNGYEKFDYKDPQKDKGKRYTFITGAEGPEERSVNKEHFNDEKNKYGEYIQIMIISSAGCRRYIINLCKTSSYFRTFLELCKNRSSFRKSYSYEISFRIT